MSACSAPSASVRRALTPLHEEGGCPDQTHKMEQQRQKEKFLPRHGSFGAAQPLGQIETSLNVVEPGAGTVELLCLARAVGKFIRPNRATATPNAPMKPSNSSSVAT